MKKRSIIISIIVGILVLLIGVYVFYITVLNELTDNIKLEPKKYLTAVEVKSKSNFILFINEENKISNIIFLNGYSIKALYKKKIENQKIDKGIEMIVDNLKNNNEFQSDTEFELIDYGDVDIYSQINSEFNKQFVVYGINKNIFSKKSSLKEKLEELNISNIEKEEEQLKKLYNISLELISRYRNNEEEYKDIDEKDIPLYANNLYSKLVSYASNITTQERNSASGIDITTINATGDYNQELYASKSSWYYIENGLVYAYINFNYNQKNYDYCYRGTEVYVEGVCS